jgi:hypothetical protein
MRLTSLHFALLLFLVCLVLTQPAGAKPVSGVVKDSQTNLPVPNVVVKIFETGDSTLTNSSGVYYFADVPLGSYTFMVGRSQYVPSILKNVSVSNSCCIGSTGNVNKSVAETPDLSDLSLLIAYLTQSPRPTLPCTQEADVNSASAVDLSDLSLLIAYLTQSPRPTLPNCL